MARTYAKGFGRQDKLCALEARWNACQACSLHERRHKLVHWRGSPTARIMLIGEAPGEEEDKCGVPFVGGAGRKLDEMLYGASLTPEFHVFVANTVACRPPNNRSPRSAEMIACSARLEAALQIVKPKVLVLAGGVAAKRLAGIQSITRWRGKWTWIEVATYNGRLLSYMAMPTFHPSYILRQGNSPELTAQVVSDLKQARMKAYGQKEKDQEAAPARREA